MNFMPNLTKTLQYSRKMNKSLSFSYLNSLQGKFQFHCS